MSVVPLTSRRGPWVERGGLLYPTFPAGTGGLDRESTALLDQLTDLEPYRIRGELGMLTAEEFAPIRAGLRALFGEALGLEPEEEAP